MGFAQWLKGKLGGRTAHAGKVLTLRDSAIARALPLHTSRESEGRRRADVAPCKCGAALAEVLITTGGAAGDAALWRAYPLAVDGWVCRSCAQITLPRFLEPDEVNALTKDGETAAKEKRFDDAELCFRRVANSWPGFASGQANLAIFLGERLVVAEDAGAPTTALLGEIRFHLEEALRDAPPPLFSGDVEAAFHTATRAVAMDGRDKINRNVLSLISDVRSGRRARPSGPRDVGAA